MRQNRVAKAKSIRKKILASQKKSAKISNLLAPKELKSKDGGDSRVSEDVVSVGWCDPLRSPGVQVNEGVFDHRHAKSVIDDVVSQLQKVGNPGVLFVNMQGMKGVTITFATQVARRLSSRGEPNSPCAPGKHLVLVDPSEDSQHGLGMVLFYNRTVMEVVFDKATPSQTALERGYLVLQKGERGQYGFVGSFPGFLRTVWQAVAERGSATTPEVTAALAIKNERDVGARLKFLCDLGLLERRPIEMASGRPGFVYFSFDATKHLRRG